MEGLIRSFVRACFCFAGIAALLLIAYAVAAGGSQPAPQAVTASEQPHGPAVPTVPRKTWQPPSPHLPDFRAGQIVSERDYVYAFVSENQGANNLADDQLIYLGEESWKALNDLGKGDGFWPDIDGSDKFLTDWNRMSVAARYDDPPRPTAYFPDKSTGF